MKEITNIPSVKHCGRVSRRFMVARSGAGSAMGVAEDGLPAGVPSDETAEWRATMNRPPVL